MRRLRDVLGGQLEQVADALLDPDHPEPVLERPRRVAVGDAAGELVEEEEAEPDRELAPEVGPPLGKCLLPAATIAVIRTCP